MHFEVTSLAVTQRPRDASWLWIFR